VAQAERLKYPYEALFRSIQKHLMDSATSEYLFSKDFFKLRSRDLFNQIFARTLSLCLENLENYLFSCYDALGLLLMIRVTHAHQLIMERRRVPCLDSFFDRVKCLLWPRFKTVFDNNLTSVKKAKAPRLGATAAPCHYVTKRYAEFAASILALHQAKVGDGATGSAEGTGDEMLLNNLTSLRQEIVKLLGRLAEEHPSVKQRMVFLINNYHQILRVFNERRIESTETQSFEELLAEQRELFVEEELQQSYSKLIAFVKRTEASMGGASAAKVDEAAVVSRCVLPYSLSVNLSLSHTHRMLVPFLPGLPLRRRKRS
jgi:hypothetical protein